MQSESLTPETLASRLIELASAIRTEHRWLAKSSRLAADNIGKPELVTGDGLSAWDMLKDADLLRLQRVEEIRSLAIDAPATVKAMLLKAALALEHGEDCSDDLCEAVAKLATEKASGQSDMQGVSLRDSESLEAKRASYTDPSNFDRNVWICEQRRNGQTWKALIEVLEENNKGWLPIYSENGCRDALKSICSHMGWSVPSVQAGRPKAKTPKTLQ